MKDVLQLLHVLPISTLEPQWLARIDKVCGTTPQEWQYDSILLLEPPAGQHVPFVEAERAMTSLFIHEGAPLDMASCKARSAYLELRPRLHGAQRVVFYDDELSDECESIPAPALIDFMREKNYVTEDILSFLEQTVHDATVSPIFYDRDRVHFSLTELPDMPPPEAMIEFIPAPPWDLGDERDQLFDQWRELIRPAVDVLNAALGEPVYWFADPDFEYSDDSGHRFLWLHWCCSYRPDSAFVRFLMETCGTSSCDEFKSALLNPANYTHPYKMNDGFIAIEAKPLQATLPPR